MQLWEASHSLSASDEVYAKHFFKDEWKSACEHRGSKLWIENVAEASQQNPTTPNQSVLEHFMQGMLKANELDMPRRALLDKARQCVASRLHSGQYRAFGFDRPRTLETQPVQLPREVWSNNPAFAHSKVMFQSLVFTDVRVRMVREDNDPLLTAGLAHSQSRPGRPTIKEDVEFVFATMENRGLIDVKRPANSHFDMVRRLLSEFYPDRYVDPNRPVNEGIRPHFTPLFRELRKNRKQ